MSNDPQANEVLDYWFGPKDGAEWGKMRKLWFTGGEQADDEIRERFAGLHARALAGELDGWQSSAEGSLALVIVLDQFSRNLHRGTKDAFAADAKGLVLTKRAIAAGFDQAVLPIQRWFFYLPFEHAEDLAEQRRAVELLSALPDGEAKKVGVDYAKQHLDVIARFGRFPHRNEMLGRETTPEEAKWLAEGGVRF